MSLCGLLQKIARSRSRVRSSRRCQFKGFACHYRPGIKVPVESKAMIVRVLNNTITMFSDKRNMMLSIKFGPMTSDLRTSLR